MTNIDKLQLFPVKDLGLRLDRAGFSAAFKELWEELQHRFFKLETLQYYDESGNPAFAAFQRGDWDEVRRQARQRAEERKDLKRVRREGIEFVRVHIIERPLSPYLQYEFATYREAALRGETILEVSAADARRAFGPLGDYLLFDDRAVLVHDYTDAGVLTGGWQIQDSPAVTHYAELARRLTSMAGPIAFD